MGKRQAPQGAVHLEPPARAASAEPRSVGHYPTAAFPVLPPCRTGWRSRHLARGESGRHPEARAAVGSLSLEAWSEEEALEVTEDPRHVATAGGVDAQAGEGL